MRTIEEGLVYEHGRHAFDELGPLRPGSSTIRPVTEGGVVRAKRHRNAEPR